MSQSRIKGLNTQEQRITLEEHNMYKEIAIEGLRGISHLEIEDFRQVNLFIGENNCGKTTILEALFLLIGAANAELPLRINAYRDFANKGMVKISENFWRLFFNNLDIDSHIKISGKLEKPEEERSLIIKPDIKSTISVKPSSRISDIVESYSELSPIDSLILEYSLKGKNGKQKKITTKVIAGSSGADIERPAEYQEHRMGVFLNQKTIGLISERFSNVQIKKRTDGVIKVLQQIEPSLRDLSLGADDIVCCDIGLDRLVPINIMGDGMFRLLSIILAVSDTQNGIVLIDEIENGFFYTSQKLLWKALFESAREFNVQIFATTHSVECIKAFSSTYSQIEQGNDAMRLYRIERKGDNFKAVTYDHKTLETSLESGWEVR